MPVHAPEEPFALASKLQAEQCLDELRQGCPSGPDTPRLTCAAVLADAREVLESPNRRYTDTLQSNPTHPQLPGGRSVIMALNTQLIECELQVTETRKTLLDAIERYNRFIVYVWDLLAEGDGWRDVEVPYPAVRQPQGGLCNGLASETAVDGQAFPKPMAHQGVSALPTLPFLPVAAVATAIQSHRGPGRSGCKT